MALETGKPRSLGGKLCGYVPHVLSSRARRSESRQRTLQAQQMCNEQTWTSRLSVWQDPSYLLVSEADFGLHEVGKLRLRCCVEAVVKQMQTVLAQLMLEDEALAESVSLAYSHGLIQREKLTACINTSLCTNICGGLLLQPEATGLNPNPKPRAFLRSFQFWCEGMSMLHGVSLHGEVVEHATPCRPLIPTLRHLQPPGWCRCRVLVIQ